MSYPGDPTFEKDVRRTLNERYGYGEERVDSIIEGWGLSQAYDWGDSHQRAAFYLDLDERCEPYYRQEPI